MSKSITFLFDSTYPIPTGGPKVVFEYANRLVENGWEVYIVYNYLASPVAFVSKMYHYFKDRLIWYFYRLRSKYPTSRLWFPIDSRVKEVFLPNIIYKNVPKTSLYVATALPTSKFLKEYPITDTRKFYIVQGYEKWCNRTDRDVRETYHYPLTKIVISNWLKNIIQNEEGLECVLAPNGFDFNYFQQFVPIEFRDKYCVSMMYHPGKAKGFYVAFEALKKVKLVYPQLKVNMFGAYDAPKKLPSWYYYVKCPNKEIHNKIYNSSAIFVSASENEGWGLTVGEAMICGNAVVCTDNLGFKEMVMDGETGLLVPVGAVDEIAKNVIRLIEDDILRQSLAINGKRYIHSFSWDKSFQIVEKLLLSRL